MESKSEHSFEDFIGGVLRHAKVNTTSITKFTSGKFITVFRNAFNHENQEFRFIGDLLFNRAIGFYIRKRFPSGNQDTFTRLKHLLISNMILEKLSIEMGFGDHVVYEDEIAVSIVKNPNLLSNGVYMTMIKNTLKSFMGAVNVIVGDANLSTGVAWTICYNLTGYLLRDTDMTISKTVTADAKTRLKEMVFDKFVSWGGLNKAFKTEQTKEDSGKISFTATLFGYPGGDWTRSRGKRATVIGEGVGGTKKEATQSASQNAIDNLSTNYNFQDIVKRFGHRR